MIRSIKDFAKIPSVLECLLMRRRLCNFNFAIVSNNCWAGRLYQDLGLTYTTPFVGLFLYADDFIRLLTNFNSINLTSLRFTDFTRYDFSRNYRKINNADYPIGLIAGDIEIHFLHYHSREEAEAKWLRRYDRLMRKELFFKYNDQNACSPAHIDSFNKLPLKHKICFSAKPYPNFRSVTFLPEFANSEHVSDDELFVYKKHFDAVSWLNGNNRNQRSLIESALSYLNVSLRAINSSIYNAGTSRSE